MANDIPKHVGLILDGNRRWAKQHNLPTAKGHEQGAQALKQVAFAAFEAGVQYVSAYVFSTENWQRSKSEVSFLMKLFTKAVQLHLDEFNQKNIKIVILGSRQGVPNAVMSELDSAVNKTANNTGGTLVLCLNYGGQQEIVDAVKLIVDAGVYGVDDINKDTLHLQMYRPDIPDVDLLIRTSGERRLSGFMLWRVAYAELYFSDKLWPDFTPADLYTALTDYKNRHRRFGV